MTLEQLLREMEDFKDYVNANEAAKRTIDGFKSSIIALLNPPPVHSPVVAEPQPLPPVEVESVSDTDPGIEEQLAAEHSGATD